MPFKIEFHKQNEILRVDIFGIREKGKIVEDAKEAWKQIAKACQESGLDRFLVTSHVTGDYSISNAYSINSVLDQFGVSRRWKIAYVVLDEKAYETLKFAETVAINRGFRGKVFQDEVEAYNWLVSKTSTA